MRMVRLAWARSCLALAAATSRSDIAGCPLDIAATALSYSLRVWAPGSHWANGSRNRSTAAEKTTTPAYAEVELPILKGTAWLPQRCRTYATIVPSATRTNETRTVPTPALLDATAAASALAAQVGTAEDSDCAGASAPAGGPCAGTAGGFGCGATVGGVARPMAVGPMTSTRRTSAMTHLSARVRISRHRLRGTDRARYRLFVTMPFRRVLRTPPAIRPAAPVPSSGAGSAGRTSAAPAPAPPGRRHGPRRPGRHHTGRRTSSQRRRQRLDRHLELVEQGEVLARRTTEGGQVVADDHRVDPAEQAVPGTEVAEGDLAPARVPENGFRQREPEGGDGAQRVAGLHDRRVPQRRAGPGVEEVQRHLVRRQRRQLYGELRALLDRLAQAEDPAAADLHPGVAHH